jgi:hypothetical protein
MTAAKKLAQVATYLETGHVERVGPKDGRPARGAAAVRLETGIYEAVRARSCLVAPEVGDKVLCAVEAEGVFIIAVLVGREGAATKLTADGDLELSARGGKVAICASEGVDIVSGRAVAMTAAEVHVRAKKGSVAVEEMGFFGRLLQAEVKKIALVAEEVDSVLGRLTQRAKRVFRFVEEIDQTRAGTIDMRAQDLIGIRAENAVISARVLTKVDGEQIHIG